MKLMHKIIIIALLICSNLLYAETAGKVKMPQHGISDAQLLKEGDALFQMWALARNYQFGTTVDKDPIKALAWQMVYIDSLPNKYPGKKSFLTSYQQGLSRQEVKKAKKLAQTLRSQYQLDFHLSEKDLAHLFALKGDKTERVTKKEKKQKTGFVGQIKPSKTIKQTNILLRQQQIETTASPWNSPIIPVTLLSNGQFYAKGLKAADYELVISLNNGKKIRKEFSLSAGKIKALASIDLSRSTGSLA